MKEIVILGAGGFGKEVAWLINNINTIRPTWKILGFIENDAKNALFGTQVYGFEILGNEEWIKDYNKELYIICALGNSKLRKKIYSRLSALAHVRLATLIDPSVTVDATNKIGHGTIICRNVTLTVDVTIGEGVLINIGSIVGHDVHIGDFCTILTNTMISGQSSMGECCEIGSGAFIFQGRHITSNCVIAPLASVLRNINESGTYSGNPACRVF